MDDRLLDLLDAWQSAFDRGAEVSPAELCRDRPDLLPELERRVADLRRVARLAADPDSTRPSAAVGPAPVAPPGDTRSFDAGLGGLEFGEKLGGGGMGDVYRARDRLGRDVAVKKMKPELTGDPKACARFLREARAAAAVQDDHVCPIYHVGGDGTDPFLVMPLLKGETLAARLRRGPLPPAEAARVGREAALGLAAAHAVGLIHRDVTPANLWLEAPAGRVKVLDFGLARSAEGDDGLSQPGSVAGTPAYMSPEQVNGSELDARSDLFALGAVLYEALTGRKAFSRPTRTATFAAVTTHDPPPPRAVTPAVPAPLSALVVRLLSSWPADRPPSAAAVAAELAGEAAPPAGRWVRRAWVLAAGAAAVVLCVAVWAATRPPGGSGDGVPEVAAPTEALRVVALTVQHYERTGPDTAVYRGPLGAVVPKADDQVTVEARLSRPAYAYLVAFGPDGQVHRLSADSPTRKADEVRYPGSGDDERYGLSEGKGLYVFAVVASDDPLPAFAAVAGGRWEPVAAASGEAYRYDGGWVEPMVMGGVLRGERGPGEKAMGASAGVVRVGVGLRSGVPGGRVAAVGFGVGGP